LHWFGPLQRCFPSMSWSQWPEQHAELIVQMSPVGLHEVAGTSQLPATQLSEQQSVLAEHFWWNERQVAQLTPGKQVGPKQQPFEQVVVLQTQAPPMHACPGAHAGFAPQVQAPFVQPSASDGLHGVHVPPFLPQVATDGASQVFPEQHPVVHVCAQPSQVLFTHGPPLHATQVAPPKPHAVATLPCWQAPFWQQPDGQLAALHTHAPPTHASPTPHGEAPPHAQAPPTHASEVVVSQTTHSAPPVPQVASEGGPHVAPLQHPLGHEVASQTHFPFWQCCPAPHAAAPPQVHVPVVHPSDTVGSHVTQPPPIAPQALIDIGAHALPLQQPIGHDVASHVHAPPTQCCPIAHGPPAPQAHAPPLHESARTGSQGTHMDPPAPQAPTEGIVQALPAQQPVVQVWAHPEHTPALHVWPAPHGVHAAPIVPHAVGEEAVQALPLQHPVGHDVASQVHAPATQCCPAAHGAALPQAHAPFLHESARTGSHGAQALPAGAHAAADVAVHAPFAQHPLAHDVASHAQAPKEQCWPGAHAALAPHTHAPAVQAVLSVGSHATHAAPPIPHVASEDGMHAFSAQHPLGHDAALHTHWALRHACPVAHAGAPPQVQLPSVHPSASFGSHATQVAPFIPHNVTDGFVHASPAQQPLGQEAAQTPLPLDVEAPPMPPVPDEELGMPPEPAVLA
jgi:hypothetical protein